MYEVDRTHRVAELIKREVAVLIARQLNDNRIKRVSITAVTVSRDLKNATIYFSLLEQLEYSPAQMGKLLNKSARYLRRLLSQNLNLRITPSLVFKYDDSIRYGAEISPLLDKLVRRREPDE